MTDWIIGFVMVFLAILGLVLASGAYDVGMTTFGFGLFAFGVLFDFWLVKKSFDAREHAVAPARTQAATGDN
ncbi:MAG TPA: hypothetical protein VMC10_16690 [Stellaceae bacterium]|nr:hypothetical protein [Stellaceae bacterium]